MSSRRETTCFKRVRGEITAQGGSRSGGSGPGLIFYVFAAVNSSSEAIFLLNGLLKRSSIRQVEHGKAF